MKIQHFYMIMVLVTMIIVNVIMVPVFVCLPTQRMITGIITIITNLVLVWVGYMEYTEIK